MTRPIERILAKLPDAKKSGSGWSACCPAHDDRQPSLSIAEGEDGRVLLKCHAGCSTEAICAAIDLQMSDLMPASDRSVNGKPRIVATYDYRDEASDLLFQVVRFEPKDFRQRRPRPGGGWDWSVKGVRTIPYRLPELLAEPTSPVFVVEGEKDADNLARIGVLATCNAGGAGKWTSDHAQFLRGRRVIVLGDNDDAGREHVEQVARSLDGIAESVRIVELPGLPDKGGRERLDRSRRNEGRIGATWPERRPHGRHDGTAVAGDSIARHGDPAGVSHARPARRARAVGGSRVARHANASRLSRRCWPWRSVRRRSRGAWWWNLAPAGSEPVNLYVAVLLDPGNRKSAVFADATRPLCEIGGRADRSRAAEHRSRPIRPAASRSPTAKAGKARGREGRREARHEAGELAAELAEQPSRSCPG